MTPRRSIPNVLALSPFYDAVLSSHRNREKHHQSSCFTDEGLRLRKPEPSARAHGVTHKSFSQGVLTCVSGEHDIPVKMAAMFTKSCEVIIYVV